MRLTLLLTTCLVLLVSAGVQADIYKWRDASGKMVFSDQPPGDRSIRYQVERRKRVQGASRGASDAIKMRAFRERQRRLLDAMQKDREQRKQDLELAEQKRLKEQEKCELVRRQLHGFETSGRVYEEQPDGTKAWLGGRERDDFIARYRKFMDDYCL